jgi:deoxyhypusine synthase
VLVTTAGSIEEDVMKSMDPFHIGSFEIPGRYLYDHGVARIGNLLVPNDRYAYFEHFMDGVLKKFYDGQKKGSIGSTSDLIRLMGKEINNEDSILYWCQKNNIPIFCPGLTDGATGDQIYFAKQRWKDFCLDISKDIKQLVDIALNADKTGVILLGGGISKHFTLNAQIFRDGADYAVYVNTGQEFDGSDSGARIDEAITWAKVKPNAPNVKVYADATLVFPIIVAATFAKSKKK